jgi:hypothetical protein
LTLLQICVLRKETSRSSFSATPVGRGSFSAAAATMPNTEQCAENVANINDIANLSGLCESVEDSIELRKIKKVQSFFRGKKSSNFKAQMRILTNGTFRLAM